MGGREVDAGVIRERDYRESGGCGLGQGVLASASRLGSQLLGADIKLSSAVVFSFL